MLGRKTLATGFLTAATALVATTVFADYDSHPEIRPENRCIDSEGRRFDPASADPATGETPAGIDTIHCQKLFWDIPVTTELGAVRVGAPFFEDSIPRFPRGVTDRIPPMYVADEDGDGVLEGYEQPGPGRTRLCEDPDEIPWWKPLRNEDGSAQIGTDTNGLTGVDENGESKGAPQEGPLFELTCHRGSRAYYGPWQVGDDPGDFDRLGSGQAVRFENTDRLNRDVDVYGHTTEDERFEWSIASEFYNHFASHHGTCYWPNPSGSHARCNRPGMPREAFQPGGDCWDGYQEPAEPEGGCYSADADQSGCSGWSGGGGTGGGFRNATQIPGRLQVQQAGEERGIQEVENQIWSCNHHVVHQLPPGSYGMTTYANYREQKGGLRNPRVPGVTCGMDENDPETSINETRSCNIYGVGPGEIFGGSVGEMVIQNLTTHATSGTRPLNVKFNVVGDAATTYYPPFTWNYHSSFWVPPFDSAVTIMAIHSHHRMVKGTMDVIPPNPPRLESTDRFCGGWGGGDAPPEAVYINWDWEDARVCQYWKDPDGPVVVRKNQAIDTTCFVNNGVTPEAIKHGLVAGATVEALKALGAPIPDYPETMEASTWGDPLAQSPVGTELLYGTHPPINYRVVYKCALAGNVPGTSLVQAPFGSLSNICDPNPAVDGDGDYVDGAYVNEAQCGGICEPSSIIFACIGEDEMCIGVAAYYALPRLGTDSHDEAMQSLQEGDLNNFGTPGSSPVPMDLLGSCPECEAGL